MDSFDQIIANLSASRNSKIIKEHYSNLTDNGSFCVNKMWKLKQKLHMKKSDMPAAKFDPNGQLITTKNGLLSLYEEEFKKRLSQDPPHPGYESIKKMKDYLFELRVQIGKNQKSENWTPKQVAKVCGTLKNNKARDNNGFIYEMFKPTLCGNDVIVSLTKMFNYMKSNMIIPDFMQSVSITSISKNNGRKSSLLSAQRGIFNLSKVNKGVILWR